MTPTKVAQEARWPRPLRRRRAAPQTASTRRSRQARSATWKPRFWTPPAWHREQQGPLPGGGDLWAGKVAWGLGLVASGAPLGLGAGVAGEALGDVGGNVVHAERERPLVVVPGENFDEVPH